MRKSLPYIVVALVLLGLLAWSRLDARLGPMVFWWYLGLSLLAFGIYGWDKLSARRSWRRIPEKSLHLLALFGGWPGALLGQQVFRHKTSKRSFQWAYWAIVALNCIGLVALVWFGAETTSA